MKTTIYKDNLDDIQQDSQIFQKVRMAIIEKGKSYGHTIENTHTLFESIDMNGDGFLSELEIKDGLRRLNIGLSGQEIVLLLKQMRLTSVCETSRCLASCEKHLHG